MFYLMMHATHFINGYIESGIWQSIIYIAREETHCCYMGYSFQLASMHNPTDRIGHTTSFVTPVMEHWLEPEIA